MGMDHFLFPDVLVSVSAFQKYRQTEARKSETGSSVSDDHSFPVRSLYRQREHCVIAASDAFLRFTGFDESDSL